MALAGAGLWLAPGVLCAANLNQNLGIWQEQVATAEISAADEAPLIVVDPVGALPPVAKPRPPIQGPAKAKAAPSAAAERAPSNVEIINKLLAPGASDPDVPLPHPALADSAGEPASANGPANNPRIFGRGEQGGGVFGLRIPFPADRHASGSNTTYSSGRTASEAAGETR